MAQWHALCASNKRVKECFKIPFSAFVNLLFHFAQGDRISFQGESGKNYCEREACVMFYLPNDGGQETLLAGRQGQSDIVFFSVPLTALNGPGSLPPNGFLHAFFPTFELIWISD